MSKGGSARLSANIFMLAPLAFESKMQGGFNAGVTCAEAIE